MKERPILFSGPMVRAILDGRKTQTRRLVKSGTFAVYGLTDDRITPIHNDYESIERCCFERNSSLSKRRLYGRKRWSDLLSDQICGLWAEGVRGLVSVERTQQREGLPLRIFVPRECEGYESRSPLGLHGVPRGAVVGFTSSPAPGRKPGEQLPGQSSMGDPNGELDRQGGPWTRHERRKASRGEAYGRRAIGLALGHLKGLVQPTACGALLGNDAGFDLADSRYRVGLHLWVKETYSAHGSFGDSGRKVYRADLGDDAKEPHGLHWRPSIFMSRKASRITLEITGVRVERLNDISEADAIAEGVTITDSIVRDDSVHASRAWVESYRQLWEQINGAGSWEVNPWVWVIEFKADRLRGGAT